MPEEKEIKQMQATAQPLNGPVGSALQDPKHRDNLKLTWLLPLQEATPEEKEMKGIEAAITLFNGPLGSALIGMQSSGTLEIDEKITEISGAPKTQTSLLIADAAAHMSEVRLSM